MENQLIHFDFSYFPTTFDILHLILAVLTLLLTVLLVVLLTCMVIGALRSGSRREAPSAVSAPAAATTPRATQVLEEPQGAPVLERQPPASAALARPEPAVAAPTALRDAAPEAALQLLGLLQKEARLLDFVAEDIAAFNDADVGVAARLVHEGCRKIVAAHFVMAPVRDEPELSRITLQAGFDPQTVRLSGNLVGSPPFTGTLIHRGWKVNSINLPQMAEGHNARILAPAEVEL